MSSIENPVTYGDGLISGDAAQGGAPEWESKPNPEESYSIEASQHFAQIGNLPKRKSLSAEDGTLTTRTGTDNKG